MSHSRSGGRTSKIFPEIISSLGKHWDIAEELYEADSDQPFSGEDFYIWGVAEKLDIRRKKVRRFLEPLKESDLVESYEKTNENGPNRVCYRYTRKGRLIFSALKMSKQIFKKKKRPKTSREKLEKMIDILDEPVETLERDIEKLMYYLESDDDNAISAGLRALESLASLSSTGVSGNPDVRQFFLDAIEDPSSYQELDILLFSFRNIFFPTDLFGDLIGNPLPDSKIDIILKKMKEYCLKEPPNESWIRPAFDIIERCDEERGDRVFEEMKSKCFQPPSKSWAQAGLRLVVSEIKHSEGTEGAKNFLKDLIREGQWYEDCIVDVAYRNRWLSGLLSDLTDICEDGGEENQEKIKRLCQSLRKAEDERVIPKGKLEI